MDKQKKYMKTLNEIGKAEYEFNFELERKIYMYLCHSRLSKRELKNLEETLRFDSYKKWKKYVCDKYRKYSADKLNEFSRYLNQAIRNTKPVIESWKLLIPVITALLLPKGVDLLYEIEEMYINNQGVGETIVLIAYLVFFISLFIWVFWMMIAPITNRNIEENFLFDYKEIVDDIIDKKEDYKSTDD